MAKCCKRMVITVTKLLQKYVDNVRCYSYTKAVMKKRLQRPIINGGNK